MDTFIVAVMLAGVLVWTVWWVIGVVNTIRRHRAGGAR